MVFDISYIRITLPGKYLKFHSIHFYIIFLLKICLYLFHPIIRWLFYLKYIFTNKKPYSFWDYIILNYDNTNDKRYMLFSSEEGWKHNPQIDYITFVTNLKAINPIYNLNEAFLANLYFHYHSTWSNINQYNDYFKLHLLKSPNFPRYHFVIENTGNFNINARYIMFTDFTSAYKNNLWGNTPIFPEVFLRKDSVGLTYTGPIETIKSFDGHISQNYLAQSFIDPTNRLSIKPLISGLNYNYNILPPQMKFLINEKINLANITHKNLLEEGIAPENIKPYMDAVLNTISENNDLFIP